jgi:hypothetical protein
MKNQKVKKMNTEINTICDFATVSSSKNPTETDTSMGTDPTNTTILTITTVNTHLAGRKLTV